MNNLDPEKLKVPAYLRKKAIFSQARQKLILTALDRKEAGLKPNSRVALAPARTRRSTPQTPSHQKTPKISRRFEPVPRELPMPELDPIPQHEAITSQYSASGGFAKIVPVGMVTDYYEKIKVAVIQLDSTLREGDIIQISAGNYLFQQPVDSMQINRKPVKIAKKGSDIGLKVALKPQHEGLVYKIVVEKPGTKISKQFKADFDQPLIN